jgi:hypothetical protein
MRKRMQTLQRQALERIALKGIGNNSRMPPKRKQVYQVLLALLLRYLTPRMQRMMVFMEGSTTMMMRISATTCQIDWMKMTQLVIFLQAMAQKVLHPQQLHVTQMGSSPLGDRLKTYRTGSIK